MAESSPTGTLSLADWLKGLVMAFGTGILILIQQLIATEADWIDKISWKTVVGAGVASGIMYIIKNLGTNSSGQLLGIKLMGPEVNK